MSDLTTTPSPTTSRNPWLRTTARWMVTFIGFPLGGLVAELVAGPVNSSRAALVGGLITGLFVGLAQWWGIGRGGPHDEFAQLLDADLVAEGGRIRAQHPQQTVRRLREQPDQRPKQ